MIAKLLRRFNIHGAFCFHLSIFGYFIKITKYLLCLHIMERYAVHHQLLEFQQDLHPKNSIWNR